MCWLVYGRNGKIKVIIKKQIYFLLKSKWPLLPFLSPLGIWEYAKVLGRQTKVWAAQTSLFHTASWDYIWGRINSYQSVLQSSRSSDSQVRPFPATSREDSTRIRHPRKVVLLHFTYSLTFSYSIREIAQAYQDMEQELAHAVNASSKSMDKVYAKSKSTEVHFQCILTVLYCTIGFAASSPYTYNLSTGPELQPCSRNGK